jgi:radical SAM protein with 4Fe4S-binding SPASM domain
MPPTVTLELTRRCHRRCAFCYVPGLRRPEGPSEDELTAGELTHFARVLVKATGCRRVQLSGGEPLLRPDLLEIVEGVSATGASVGVITDGAQLTPSLARELAARSVGPVQPTLLSGDAKLHDELRGQGAFRDATRATAVASAAGLQVVVCMVLTSRNCSESGRVAELAFALGASALTLSRFCPAGGATGRYKDLMPEARHVRDAAEAAARVCAQLGLPLSAAVTIPRCVWKEPEHPPLRVGVCSLVGSGPAITVGPDGSVRSCSLSSMHAGNLRRESWEVVSRRLAEQELEPVRAAVPQACSGCQWFDRCRAGCRMSAKAVFGHLGSPDPLAPCAPPAETA